MQDGDAREESEVAVFAILERGFDSLPISPAPDQLQQLAALVLLLEAWAGKINLTGHRDAAAMTRGLVLDAAALAAALPELEDARTVADLGTGAGFPGLPLAILFPAAEFFLVDGARDPTEKAAHVAVDPVPPRFTDEASDLSKALSSVELGGTDRVLVAHTFEHEPAVVKAQIHLAGEIPEAWRALHLLEDPLEVTRRHLEVRVELADVVERLPVDRECRRGQRVASD